MCENGVFPEQFIAAVTAFGDEAVQMDFTSGNPNKSGSAKYFDGKIKVKMGRDNWVMTDPMFKLNSVPVFGVQAFDKRRENNVQARPSISIKKSTCGTRMVKGRDGKLKPYNERIGLALYYYNTIFLKKAAAAAEGAGIDWVAGGTQEFLSKVQYKDKAGNTIGDPYIRMDLPTYRDDDGNSQLDDTAIYDIDKKLSKEEQTTLTEEDLPYEFGKVADKSLTFRNIEYFIKGGAKVTGLLNARAAVSSKQGLSTPFKLEFILVKQSSGRRVKPRNVFSQAELDFSATDQSTIDDDYFAEEEDPLAAISTPPPSIVPPEVDVTADTSTEKIDAAAEEEIRARMEAAAQSRRGDA